MTAPDSIVSPELRLGERLEARDAVDVIPLSCELAFPIVKSVVPLAVGYETTVEKKRIRVDRAAFRNFLFDGESQDRARDICHGAGVHPLPLRLRILKTATLLAVSFPRLFLRYRPK